MSRSAKALALTAVLIIGAAGLDAVNALALKIPRLTTTGLFPSPVVAQISVRFN